MAGRLILVMYFATINFCNKICQKLTQAHLPLNLTSEIAG